MISISSISAGGGWPAGKGKGYIKLAEWWVVSNKHYTDVGLIDPHITRGIYTTSLYGEYGLTDKWTAIAYIPVYSRATVNNEVSATTGEILIPGDAIGGIGDVDLGIKYSFNADKAIKVSASVMLGIPIGEDAGGTNGSLQIGDGEFNQLIKIDAGTGFALGSINGYANIYGGYNNRSNGFSDEIRWGAEAGVSALKDKLGFTLRVTAISSTNNGSSIAPANSTSIFANNAEYVAIEPEIRFNFLKNTGLSASYSTASSGRLIFANPSYSVGVYTSW